MLGHVTSGLRYLRFKGMIHRDIKLANIFVSSGVAKIGAIGPCSRKEHADSNGVCGTLQYLPPDVLSQTAGMSERNDIWGLGCVLIFG